MNVVTWMILTAGCLVCGLLSLLFGFSRSAWMFLTLTLTFALFLVIDLASKGTP